VPPREWIPFVPLFDRTRARGTGSAGAVRPSAERLQPPTASIEKPSSKIGLRNAASSVRYWPVSDQITIPRNSGLEQ
jgi:hypothetical protein